MDMFFLEVLKSILKNLKDQKEERKVKLKVTVNVFVTDDSVLEIWVEKVREDYFGGDVNEMKVLLVNKVCNFLEDV